MNDDSQMWQRVCLIYSHTGYLEFKDKIFSIKPKSYRDDVYNVGGGTLWCYL